MASDSGRSAPFFSASPSLAEWLSEAGVSLALTSYQAGKLLMIGLDPQGRLAVSARSFGRCVGLAGDAQTLWMSTLYQLWRLENVGASGGCDRRYAPRASYVTGALNVHDIGVEARGGPIFVNTLFSCLARPSPSASFRPVWRPPFVSRLAAEDRCHLNGLAMRDGAAAFVTAAAATDTAGGWRGWRADGGVAVEVASGEIALPGLSMPHSPRWHDGNLWLLNSGTGEVGWADLAAGRFEPIAYCPGFTRGLAFAAGCAVVGLSKPTRGRTFEGLALAERLGAGGAESGFRVIDTASGAERAWLRFDAVIDEVYDIVCLRGVRRPGAVGLKSNEIERVLNISAA